MLLVLLAFCALLLRNLKKNKKKELTFTVNSLSVCLDLICFQLINKTSHLTSLPLCLVFVGGGGEMGQTYAITLFQNNSTTRHIIFTSAQ